MTEQLSPLEAIMWRVGQDATLRMTVGTLMILDRSPTAEALADRVALVAHRAPRLSRRPDDPTGIRARPAWIDEPDPAPAHHLRTLSVAAPGSMRQLLDLVGLLEAIPFDPDRSPWDLTLIEGLEDGRAALYLRAHHVLTDGVGGMRLLGLLLDEPQWPGVGIPTPVPPKPAVAAPASNGDRRPGTLTVTIDLTKAVRRFISTAQFARSVDPIDTAVRGVQRALDAANSVSRQLMVTGGPLAERPASSSMLSRFEVLSVEDARSAALALGGSRNDLVVAAAAAGLGTYYERLGQPCLELRLATPAGQRRNHEAGGNWFAPTRLEVPTTVGRRPGPQFGVVVERLAQSRREPALRLASSLATTIGRLPTRMLLPALHAQADSVDFTATALPGLRGARHICGAQIESSYPLGPRLGCPMNITAFGNGDRLDVGIALDEGAFAQPEALVDCLRDAFGALAAASDAVGDADRGAPAGREPG
ncbi:MAG: wax ester/triacylglycerol synthase domain-containing protein [Ilumatobacteraceae bacterium]